MVVCGDKEIGADLLDVLWGQASGGGEVVLDAAVLVTKQLQKGEHRVMSRGGIGRLFEGARNRRRRPVSYRQVNMFSAASVLEAKSGTCARRAMTICRAGSRPTRVKA